MTILYLEKTNKVKINIAFINCFVDIMKAFLVIPLMNEGICISAGK